MRIIAGRFKGHHLVSFKADHIRPTTDRVKESLFNKFQFEIEGARCLDLFCGTGNLGLEALSRGAQYVIFVEKNPKSILITRGNIEKLRVDTSEYKIINQDVLAFLKKYDGEAFDIIFIDPPFTQKMAHDVMLALSESTAFKPGTLIAIESAAQERMDDRYGVFHRYDFREYGDKILSFFTPDQEEK